MDIVKRCCAEHRLPSCSKLRLGTLLDYRRSEDEELRDREEGRYTLTFRLTENMILPREFCSGLFPGLAGLFPEIAQSRPLFYTDPRGEQDWSGMNIVVDHDQVRVLSGGVQTWMFPNSFVLSMQTGSDQPFTNGGKYDADWRIREDDANTFAEQLRVLVSQQVRPIQAIMSPYLDLVGSSDNLSVTVRHSKVEYESGEFSLEDMDLNDPQSVVERLWRAPFMKSDLFSYQNEYRFVVALEFDGRPVPIHQRFLFIPSETLYQYLL